MRAVQHVIRRGAVYWWRRRLLQKIGESELAPIALSLRTRELSKARIVAAHLVVASDGILRQEGRNVLSPVHVRAMLEAVARTHLAKLDRLAALETADGISAEEGRVSDRTTGWARRLQASQGIAATVGDTERSILTANGLAPDEIEQVGLTLDLLRQNSNGTFPRQKLIALLEACGASQGEGDIRQAERIYYRGQAAALLAVDRRWSGHFVEDDRLIEELLNQQRPIVVNAVPTGSQHKSGSGQPEDLERAEPQHDANTSGVTDAGGPKEASILKLTERLVQEKAALGEWNAKTRRQVGSVVALFVDMIGDDHVRSLAQNRVAEYRSLLLSLPRTYGKGQNDRKTPLSIWLERAKTLPKDKVGREPGTLKGVPNKWEEVFMG